MAEIFLATPLLADDRTRLAELNGALWSKIDGAAAGGARMAEATMPMPVRCLLRDGKGGESYKPCMLSGRTVVHPDSRSVFSAFSLAPRKEVPRLLSPRRTHRPPDHSTACPLHPFSLAVLTDPHPPSQPGDDSPECRLPVDELLSALEETKPEPEPAAEEFSYNELEDLGLCLEPEDAALLMESEVGASKS